MFENVLINRSLLLPCTTYDGDNSESLQFLHMTSMPPGLNSTTELISYNVTLYSIRPYFRLLETLATRMLILFSEPIFLNWLWGENRSLASNRTPANSCHIVFMLKMYWLTGVSFSHAQHMMMTILKSSIPPHGIDASRTQFHNGIDFSQGIKSPLLG